jgi:hypothetical protein
LQRTSQFHHKTFNAELKTVLINDSTARITSTRVEPSQVAQCTRCLTQLDSKDMETIK